MTTMLRGISDMEGPLVKYVDVMDADVDLGLDAVEEADRQRAIGVVSFMEGLYEKGVAGEIRGDDAWCTRRVALAEVWRFEAICRKYFTEKHKENK